MGIVVLLSQIPFACNRFRVRQLATKISELNAKPNLSNDLGYRDYKGAVHVHSFLGGHSTGTFEELLDGAKKNSLDFVVMTEHVSDSFDSSAKTLNDFHREVLFLGGNETNDGNGNRFLILDGFAKLKETKELETPRFLEEAHARERLAFVTYPEKFRAWETEIDGIEVFSLHTNAKGMNPLTFLLDAMWSYRSYPKLTLARHLQHPTENLAKFDQISESRKLTLFGGSDAHSNLGLHIGDDSNNKFFNLKFDKYETILGVATNHVLIPKDRPLSKESLLRALKNGNLYLSVDALCDPKGFTFAATNNDETKIVGEEVSLENGAIKLSARSPQKARFVLFRNGVKIFETADAAVIEYGATKKGAYRLEVYLDNLDAPFDKMPWIISNPIYIR